MSLQVWLPLNGDLHNQGLDDIAITGQSISGYSDNGKIGKALTLLNSYCSFNVPSLANSTILSCAFWYKRNADSSLTDNWRKVLIFNTSNGTTNGNVRFESSYGSAASFISTHSNGAYLVCPNTVGNRTLIVLSEAGAWHHLAMTFDGDTITYYVDGAVHHSGAQVDGYFTGGVTIGISNASADGFMNDLRIYDHCLSPKEVKELSKGLVAHYPLNDGVGGENLILSDQSHWYLFNKNHTLERTNDGIKMTVTSSAPNGFMIPFASDNTLVGGETFTLTFKYKTNISKFNAIYLMCRSGGNIPIWLSSTNYYSLNEWKTFSFTSLFPSTSDQVTYAILIPYIREVNSWVEIKDNTLKLEKGSIATPWIPNPSDELYSSMGFDNGVVYDCSGYGRNGVTIGEQISSADTPRYSACLSFTNDTNQRYIRDIYVLRGMTMGEVSVSLWFKTDTINDSLSGDGGNFFSFGYNSGLRARIPKSNGSAIWVYSHLSAAIFTSTSSLADGKWHQLTIVFDNGLMLCYIDGLQIESTVTKSAETITFGDNEYYRIATVQNGLEHFIGSLSDFRIYATALSAEDIKELYETSASVDNHGNFYAYEIQEV